MRPTGKRGGDFLSAGTATVAQIAFINMIIAPTGPDQVFDETRVARLFKKIQEINASAVA